ncbi:sugar transporter domain-containing protein [Phthorimaea operculella]|nr:sugar transporter domain-containing protein [Phthorimaea operculella]
MESCEYKKVEIINENSEKLKVSWTPFLRQLLVCSGLFTTYFVTGLSFGAPTVVIPQLRRNNVTISDEMASWLSSATSYSSMPWVIILPIVTHRIGRKIPFYFAISCSVTSFFLFYFGTTTTTFLTSQVFQGVLFASNLSISVIMVTEYTSPKYRGIFLSIKSASVWWGMWASNAIGTFFKWNYIGLFGLICSIWYLTAFIWPESPHWLATKGRFEECAKAHRWLKGVDKESEDELIKLIDSQKEYLDNNPKSRSFKDEVKNFSSMITKREFYMPIALSVLVMAQFHASGKVICSIYSIELIKKITDNESTAYTGMLILDGVGVLEIEEYFKSPNLRKEDEQLDVKEATELIDMTCKK